MLRNPDRLRPTEVNSNAAKKVGTLLIRLRRDETDGHQHDAESHHSLQTESVEGPSLHRTQEATLDPVERVARRTGWSCSNRTGPAGRRRTDRRPAPSADRAGTGSRRRPTPPSSRSTPDRATIRWDSAADCVATPVSDRKLGAGYSLELLTFERPTTTSPVSPPNHRPQRAANSPAIRSSHTGEATYATHQDRGHHRPRLRRPGHAAEDDRSRHGRGPNRPGPRQARGTSREVPQHSSRRGGGRRQRWHPRRPTRTQGALRSVPRGWRGLRRRRTGHLHRRRSSLIDPSHLDRLREPRLRCRGWRRTRAGRRKCHLRGRVQGRRHPSCPRAPRFASPGPARPAGAVGSPADHHADGRGHPVRRRVHRSGRRHGCPFVRSQCSRRPIARRRTTAPRPVGRRQDRDPGRGREPRGHHRRVRRGDGCPR